MAGLISKARGIIGQRRMERKINTLVRRGGPAIGRSTMSAMAAPLKGSIRRGVDGTNENKSLKRAVKATVGHRLMKAKFDAEQGMKVGFSAGRRTKAVRGSKTRAPTAKAAKATTRASSKRPGVGISSTNVHWIIFGTGAKVTNVATSSRATGKTRRHKSGKSTGSTKPYFNGVVEKAVISGTPAAMKKGAAAAKKALKKQALRLKRK